MTTSVETAVVDFLEPAIAAALGTDGPLDSIEAHHTPYQVFLTDNGVSVLLHKAEFAPDASAEAVGEFNGLLPIICYARVTGPDKTQRAAARDKADSIAKAIAKLFFDDPTIDGSVVFARPDKVQGGWDVERGQIYMVVTFELRFNELTNDLTEK